MRYLADNMPGFVYGVISWGGSERVPQRARMGTRGNILPEIFRIFVRKLVQLQSTCMRVVLLPT